jgi:phosphonate transport system substrate-binding protein
VLRVATFLAPSIAPTYAWVAEALARRVGDHAELHVGTVYDELGDGRADLAFICGLPYVRLADASPPVLEVLGAPVLRDPRCGGRPIYFSDVIVRAAAPHRRFEDLRGASWAFNEPDSQSGYGVTRARLARMGATSGFFGAVIEAGFHQRSIELVAAGEVDASAIDSQVLAVALRDQPGLAAGLRVIDTLGPSTIQPLVAATRLSADLREALRAALPGLHEDADAAPALAHGLVDRFVTRTDRDYDDIRRMDAEAGASGLVGLGTPARRPATGPPPRG